MNCERCGWSTPHYSVHHANVEACLAASRERARTFRRVLGELVHEVRELQALLMVSVAAQFDGGTSETPLHCGVPMLGAGIGWRCRACGSVLDAELRKDKSPLVHKDGTPATERGGY